MGPSPSPSPPPPPPSPSQSPSTPPPPTAVPAPAPAAPAPAALAPAPLPGGGGRAAEKVPLQGGTRCAGGLPGQRFLPCFCAAAAAAATAAATATAESPQSPCAERVGFPNACRRGTWIPVYSCHRLKRAAPKAGRCSSACAAPRAEAAAGRLFPGPWALTHARVVRETRSSKQRLAAVAAVAAVAAGFCCCCRLRLLLA